MYFFKNISISKEIKTFPFKRENRYVVIKQEIYNLSILEKTQIFIPKIPSSLYVLYTTVCVA